MMGPRRALATFDKQKTAVGILPRPRSYDFHGVVPQHPSVQLAVMESRSSPKLLLHAAEYSGGHETKIAI